jgi:hypothetical protein
MKNEFNYIKHQRLITMKKLSILFFLTVAVFFMQSCQKEELIDDPYANQPAPELPSEKAFIMPMTGLDDDQAAPKSYGNWGHSVANIVVWNTVLTIHMAIPTLSFYAAIGQEPEYQGQGVWLWSYEFTDDEDGATYRAELYGELLVSNEVKWDMYIAQVDGFARIHWYTGITANDDSYARWTLNYLPENPTPFLQIDFQRGENGVEAIRYTNIIPADAENGSYIEYREGTGVADEFDRAYDVFKAEINNLLEINWDETNHNGRVKDPEKYGDTDWHCWGVDLKDTEC